MDYISYQTAIYGFRILSTSYFISFSSFLASLFIYFLFFSLLIFITSALYILLFTAFIFIILSLFLSSPPQGHESFIKMLCSQSANCHVRSAQSRNPLDLITSNSKRTREQLRSIFLSVEPRLRTLILYPEDCLESAHTGVSSLNVPDRLKEIMKLLRDHNQVSVTTYVHNFLVGVRCYSFCCS